jgi:tRNA(fMet)-specific endonuclease VapC
MSVRYLLDTNAVSGAISARSPGMLRRLAASSRDDVCVSAISYGEIQYGLARRPEATRLRQAAEAFFDAVDVLPWTSKSADSYGVLRADMERRGKSLTALDMLIAAHALEVDATLVSADRAFRFVEGLAVEDWSQP